MAAWWCFHGDFHEKWAFYKGFHRFFTIHGMVNNGKMGNFMGLGVDI
jgi:hypothetical protein